MVFLDSGGFGGLSNWLISVSLGFELFDAVDWLKQHRSELEEGHSKHVGDFFQITYGEVFLAGEFLVRQRPFASNRFGYVFLRHAPSSHLPSDIGSHEFRFACHPTSFLVSLLITDSTYLDTLTRVLN
jgi:hypothetical protein